ncbi:battenin-like isoform X1 [Convolutriloba macropyga]|uniref:battenin-like isoform X1 n=1 Tax=Convolutriloba macropyga TaxID=536237 RepID=UPI003F527888
MATLQPNKEKEEKKQNIVAFWVMATTQLSIRSGLSTSAHDLLSINIHHLTIVKNQASSLVRYPETECNASSTGSIIAVCYVFNLLAAMVIIMCCYEASPIVKLTLMEVFFVTGFVIITFSHALWSLFCGVIVIGIAISLFELTIPPLASTYKVQATNALAAGAGMAQTLGSTIYVSMKAIAVSTEEPFYPFIIVNITGLLVFLLLVTPPSTEKEDRKINELWSTEQELEIIPLIVGSGSGLASSANEKQKLDSKLIETDKLMNDQSLGCRRKFCSICHKEQRLKSGSFSSYFSMSEDWCEAAANLRDIFVYLSLFYFLEYYTNLGILEHATVRSSTLRTSEQYRWLMFSYHLTQTIVRSIPLPNFMEQLLGPITIAQAIVTAVLFSQSVFDYMIHFEILVTFIVVEGCLGSVAYMIGLRYARSCSEKEGVKKAATILVLAADILALGLGSLAAVSSHEILCRQRMGIHLNSIRNQFNTKTHNISRTLIS